jgi:hypothetical protein
MLRSKPLLNIKVLKVFLAITSMARGSRSELTGKRTGYRDERGIALELMYRYSGASQSRIGQLVGLDYTAVGRERKRLRDGIESDNKLKKRLGEIEASLLS